MIKTEFTYYIYSRSFIFYNILQKKINSWFEYVYINEPKVYFKIIIKKIFSLR